MKCAACGGENVENARFCKHCGASISAPAALACPACGAANKADAAFCVACGHGFGQAATAPAMDATQPYLAPTASSDAPPGPSKWALILAAVIAVLAIGLTGYILFSGGKTAPAPETASAPPEIRKPAAPASKGASVLPQMEDEKTPAPAASAKKPAPPVKPAVQPAKPAVQNTPPVAKPAQKPLPAEPAPIAAPSNKSNFERELDACKSKGFFERGICSEQVKWKYCTVNSVWDASKPGCER